MNFKLLVLFALINLAFAQYGPEFDGAGLPQPVGDSGEEYAAQPDFEGDGAEVPFEGVQENAFEGGEYAGGPQGMMPNEQLQQGYPEESIRRAKFMSYN